MCLKNKLSIVVAGLLLSQAAFATAITPLKLQFVNHTTQNGRAFVYVTEKITKGQEVKKNSELLTPMTYYTNQDSAMVGLWIGRLGQMCIYQKHNVQFNMKAYKGDTITITYKALLPQGGVECTCTGSACDLSGSSQVKKSIQ